ncbi:MAG: hypothetical protein GXP63_05185 [DPANN group archaeon]|nr:hypothetical protein [DPANN group archaeon]
MRLLDLKKVYQEAANASDLFSAEPRTTNEKTNIISNTNEDYSDEIIDLVLDSIYAIQDAEINRNIVAESYTPRSMRANYLSDYKEIYELLEDQTANVQDIRDIAHQVRGLADQARSDGDVLDQLKMDSYAEYLERKADEYATLFSEVFNLQENGFRPRLGRYIQN